MQLTFSQRHLVQSTLLATFTGDELRALAAKKLGANLQEIEPGASRYEAAFNVVAWAERKGRVLDLAQAAAAQRPTDAGLAALVVQVQAWQQKQSSLESWPRSRRLRRILVTLAIILVLAVAFLILAYSLWRPLVTAPAIPTVQEAMDQIEPNSSAVWNLSKAMPDPSKPVQQVLAGKEAQAAIEAAGRINAAVQDSLQDGLLAFTVPPTMTAGTVYPVTARISGGTSAAIQKELTAGLPASGMHASGDTPPTQPIKISPEMKAQLVAENEGDFRIVSLSSPVQIVGQTPYTEWQWRVTPRAWGQKKLLLTISALLIDSSGREHEWSLPVFEQAIDIQVSPAYVLASFVSANWLWIATGIAILGAAIAWWRIGRRPRPVDHHAATHAGARLERLHAALLDAFPGKAELQQLVKFHLDQNLETIAGGENLSDITFNLLMWAEAEGRLDELVAAALHANPDNPSLKQFAQDYPLPAPLPTAAA